MIFDFRIKERPLCLQYSLYLNPFTPNIYFYSFLKLSKEGIKHTLKSLKCITT